ncbi:class I SAM-dependent methyltransferase [Nocardioides sp.]|uniref:class I SAM-dependent methyltransferase n=1 Tax=Nocardioides sp. TaxID=35761 RepID=UPI002C24FBE1|nr:class I SAM-dependent methyltransferase [Nocardioides sp.]HXH78009.1 class I SAM-dependent methyltransferase [Nocardioides sp.]
MSDAGSPSLEHPEYWWYRARSELLSATLQDYVSAPGARPRILDVGSADGPSVGWLRDRGFRVGMDVDPRGLRPGDVQASAMDLPFAASSFDVVAAFDVVEHCDPEERVLAEISRVLVPGGRLLMSVPAYEWAWTSHDDHNQHHRRYTKRRAVAALSAQGFQVLRATYAFAGTFPMFAADRLRRRATERRRGPRDSPAEGVPALPVVHPRTEQLLMGLSSLDRRILSRWDLPFGSSVVVAAKKPDTQ